MMVYLFDGDDAGYLTWIEKHPEGFVLNMKRQDGTRICSIHRADCAHIRVVRNQSGPGGFTERTGIKFCAPFYHELVEHLSSNRRSPLLKVIPCKRCGQGKVDLVLERSPDEVDPEYADGPHAVSIQVNRYEHDPMARAKCIRVQGQLCAVCNVDLELTYGILGKHAMPVHHTHPLHLLEVEYVLDPVDDLVPVCPNCHLIMHRGREQALSVEQLRRIIAHTRAQRAKARMEQGYY